MCVIIFYLLLLIQEFYRTSCIRKLLKTVLSEIKSHILEQWNIEWHIVFLLNMYICANIQEYFIAQNR